MDRELRPTCPHPQPEAERPSGRGECERVPRPERPSGRSEQEREAPRQRIPAIGTGWSTATPSDADREVSPTTSRPTTTGADESTSTTK